MPSTGPGAFWTLSHLSLPTTHFTVEEIGLASVGALPKSQEEKMATLGFKL